jgi:hypothetical protein
MNILTTMVLVVKYQGIKGLISFLSKRIERGLMSRKKKKNFWNRSSHVSLPSKVYHAVELKKRVVFVDINGTLTSLRTMAETEAYIHAQLKPGENPNSKEIKERVWEAQKQTIDPVCVELLKEFAKKNNAAVVICSTSRGGGQGNFVEKVLRDYNIEIGPFLPRGGALSCKGSEVESYMWRNVKNGGGLHYVIFDDGLDYLIKQDDHLVRVDCKTGITSQDIEWGQQIFDDLGEPQWEEDRVKSRILLPAGHQSSDHLSIEEREQLSFPGLGEEDTQTKNWPIRGRLNPAL